MSNFAEVNVNVVIQYPYTFSNLQAENPYTDYGGNDNVAYWFPKTNAATQKGYKLVQVRQLPQPAYDPYTQNCTQNTTPQLVSKEWVNGWTITEKTPEEKAAYVQNIKDQNKQQATTLLNNTDWTSIPSVGSPVQSNPYLVNQPEFFAYRSQVRDIALDPPPTPVENWPTPPVEIWQPSPS